jgi:hypothetical protein
MHALLSPLARLVGVVHRHHCFSGERLGFELDYDDARAFAECARKRALVVARSFCGFDQGQENTKRTASCLAAVLLYMARAVPQI